MSPPVRMLLRNLERRPVRAALSILAISLATAILVLTLFSFDSMAEVIDIQFRTAQNDDVQLTLRAPSSANALRSLRGLPGVLRVEPVRAVPVKIRSRQVVRRTALLGLDTPHDLRRIVNMDGKRVELPVRGMLLSTRLAGVLGVGPGDDVVVESIEGSRTTMRIQVTARADEMMGMSAYAPRGDVNAFMREGDVVTGAWLAIDHGSPAGLYSRLKKMPGVATVDLREAMVESFKNTIAKNNVISMSVVAFFACIVAFGMVYNSARIALSERGRDLATLRVLGFSQREVGLLLVGEQAILTLCAIPLGFLIGYWLSWAVVRMYDTEQFRIPLVLSARTFALAFLVIAVSASLSALAVHRRIRTLDLVEVLKTRE